tara:strand:+ start:8351 stop:8605 length:255 start_codon:yes stop_codon:yes gene_type:complete
MRITFQIPEILILSSTAFFLSSMTTLALIHLSCGLFLAFCRFGMHQKEKQDRQDSTEKIVKDILVEGVGFLSNLSNSQNIRNLH